MFKLLKSGLSRAKQNRVLFVLIIITIGIALFFVINNLKFRNTDTLDKALLNYINIVGIFIAMFTSLFIGAEYEYGTIRNKIIVGHSRINIYFSNLIISILAGIVLEIVYILTIVLFGVLLHFKFELSFMQYAILLLEIIFVISSFSSVFTLISFAFSNVTFSTSAGMLIFLGFYIICTNLAYPVNMPEYITNSYYDEQGIEHITESIVNPNYPSKEKMFIYKNIYYAIPAGQALEITAKVEEVDTFNLILYSIGSIFVVNIIGVFIFNKKELN